MNRSSRPAIAAPTIATNVPRTISAIIGPDSASGTVGPTEFPYSSVPQLPDLDRLRDPVDEEREPAGGQRQPDQHADDESHRAILTVRVQTEREPPAR